MAANVVEAQVVVAVDRVEIAAVVAVVTVAEAVVVTVVVAEVEIIAAAVEALHAAKLTTHTIFQTNQTFNKEYLRYATHAQADQVPQITSRKPCW